MSRWGGKVKTYDEWSDEFGLDEDPDVKIVDGLHTGEWWTCYKANLSHIKTFSPD